MSLTIEQIHTEMGRWLGTRRFVCEECNQEHVAEARGPLPRLCIGCRAPSNAVNGNTRKTIRQLNAQVKTLEGLLAKAEQRTATIPEAELLLARMSLEDFDTDGRAMLGRAVKGVVRATGTSQTQAALLQLAAVATAWANRLS